MSLTLLTSPEELREKFISMRTAQDVADLLDIDLQCLIYHLYILPDYKRYVTFEIPKKSGGMRTISAPATALKIIQQKLNQVLQHVYQQKPSVHGFTLERSILTNAEMHSKRRYIFNVDLKEFFPSINFGRVRGLFIFPPYNRDSAVATILAQICCFNNGLPQGAPTSPIISNMICSRMDRELQDVAKQHQCNYTRYADDITFSTYVRDFPSALARIASSGQVEVGTDLESIINNNGFDINPNKVRLKTRNQRQEVTGLTTNQFPNVRRKYVRQIRAMLHAWEKFGLEAAEQEYLKRYNKKHRGHFKQAPLFKQVVKGKVEFLGMIRGKDNVIYLRLRGQLERLLGVAQGEHMIAISADMAEPRRVGRSKTRIIFIEGEQYSADIEIYGAAYPPSKHNIRFVPVGNSDTVRTMVEQFNKSVREHIDFQKVFGIIDGDIECVQSEPKEGESLFRLPVYHVENLLLDENKILEVTRSLMGLQCPYTKAGEVLEDLKKLVLLEAHLRSYTGALLDARKAEVFKQQIVSPKKFEYNEIEEEARRLLESSVADGTWRAKCKGRELLKAYCGKHGLTYKYIRNTLIDKLTAPPKELSEIMIHILK